MERLQKYLAACGVCSRRRAEELILRGEVLVNGTVVRELGTKVDPSSDLVEASGRVVKPQTTFVYILLNKPRGVLSSVSDDRGRTCAVDLLGPGMVRVYPVGRLDYDSQGLLLLTNDGALANCLTHPRYHMSKTYVVTVPGSLRQTEVDKLQTGVDIGGYVTRPCRANILSRSERETRIEMTIYEGKNRQVRRMLEALGRQVVRLERVAMGPLSIDGLSAGQWRHLTKKEIRSLREAVAGR